MTCSSTEVAGLTPTQLVAYLESTTTSCLYDFMWTFDSNVAGVLSAAHVTAVLNRIAMVSSGYDATDNLHLAELTYFVHVAYYQQYYHSATPGLFTPAAVKQAAQSAFDAFSLNAHWNDFNSTASGIRYDWVNAVDGASLADRYYAQLVEMLHTFNSDPQRRSDYAEGMAVRSAMLVIYRQLWSPAFVPVLDGSLLQELTTLATNSSLPPNSEWAATVAIYVLGGVCEKSSAWKSVAVQAITDARAAWPQFSGPWLQTVISLDFCNGCLDANNVKLCRSDVVVQLEAQDLPNTYSFDDGAIIVRTPLTLAEVQPLYHATKVVQAQLNRLTQSIAPLPGDPTDVLTIILFGSRAAYERDGPFLYNLSTNNGGIYLEERQTFYTYDRTLQESYYPLEELFRHEFAHYVVARFLVAGLWGQAPIYAGGRMIWFDEGLAEFVTWSTTSSGIKPRKRLVQLIAGDGASRMTVAQVVSSAYGDFKFYRYAAMLFSYFYEYDLATFLQLIDLVRAGDVPGYDAKIAQLKTDANLQTAYDQYLLDLIANVVTLDDPSTVTPPLNALDAGTVATVQSLIRQTRVGYLADVTVAAEDVNTRFSARGALAGTLTAQRNDVDAWRTFTADIDEMISQLEGMNVNNFDALAGRFGRIRWLESGGQVYPQADYFVEGPLPHGSATLLSPVDQVAADFQSVRLGLNAHVTSTSPNAVEVHLTLGTRLYPSGTQSAVFDADLEDARAELRNQVYAIRPSYYRSFEVEWDGARQTITYLGGEMSGVRDVRCRVRVP